MGGGDVRRRYGNSERGPRDAVARDADWRAASSGLNVMD